MTFAEISTMLKEVGIPTAYYQFDESTGQQPPFICFFYPNDDDFHADNVNYAKIRALKVELYTDEKDFTLEGTLEDVLTSHGVSFGKQELYLGDERMYEVVYSAEVLITDAGDADGDAAGNVTENVTENDAVNGTDTDTDTGSEEGKNE